MERGRISKIMGIKFDFKMRNVLAKILHTQGSLLGGPVVDHQRDEQLRFLEKVIREVKPLHIVETGTHFAGFDYFVVLIDKSIRIDTFGINEGSQKAVDILNEHFKTDIQFHLGDSVETFTKFTPEYKIDFAWIDGGHTEEICLIDLYNCARLEIGHICCDDYSMARAVRKAVADFLYSYPEYKVQDIDSEIDKRRIIYLKRG